LFAYAWSALWTLSNIGHRERERERRGMKVKFNFLVDQIEK